MYLKFNPIARHERLQTGTGFKGLRAVWGWMVLCLVSIKFKIKPIKNHTFSLLQRFRTVLMALLFGMLVSVFTSPAFGAITYVKDLGTASSTTTGTTIQVLVPAGGVAAGNTVIVVFAMDDVTGSVTCADQQNGSYGAADVDQRNTNQVRTVVFSAYITNALSSGDWIRVTHPSVGDRVMHAIEFSGLPNSALDQTASNSGNDTNMSSTSTPSATSDPNELLIGGIGVADVERAAVEV